MILVNQDSCRLNNIESSLYTASCNVDIVDCIIFIGKGIPPNTHANFCLLSLFCALNIQIFHIQVSNNVQCLNFCYSSMIQMVWFIFIHVIIEVIDVSLTSNACLSRQDHFHHFSFCNCINFGEMAEVQQAYFSII